MRISTERFMQRIEELRTENDEQAAQIEQLQEKILGVRNNLQGRINLRLAGEKFRGYGEEEFLKSVLEWIDKDAQ